MDEEILHNSPALHALKRHQLVSLSKRYGLRASGKNVEMIDRLKEFAANLTPTRQLSLPLPASTPAIGLSDFAIDPTPISPSSSPDRRLSRASDTWSVLSASGASLISPAKAGMTKSNSCSSWKSAGNGEALSEFGGLSEPISNRSKSSSIRSLASSLSRRASKHLMSRSSSATAQLNKLTTEPEPEDEVEVEVEIMDTVCPPSPASTVGIPRRRSTLSLMEQPSTIRLCSPTPTLPIAKAQVDELPFFGTSTVKERRSMAPIRQAPIINIHTRKSMPAIAGGSASITNIYPPLPVDIPPVPPIPGAYQKSSPQKPFGFSVSNADFSSAAQQVISDMQAKMQARGIGTTSFGEELLKGKSAEMDKLVHTTRGLGEGGWGLRNMASSSSIQDRYAAAHQKDFARMQSIGESRKKAAKPDISASTSTVTTVAPVTPGKRKHSGGHPMPSAPNGRPLINDEVRESKRKRLSVGPSGFGSLREAGRSLVSILGDGAKATPRRKRRSSLMNGRFSSRFAGIFKTRQNIPAKPTTTMTTSQTMPSLSANRPDRSPGGRSVLDLANHIDRRQARERGRSTSAQTMASTASRTPVRSRLPDFGVPPSQSGSLNSLGLPKSKSSSLSSTTSMKKQSQAEIIRKARPAPAPPASMNRAPSGSGIPRPTSIAIKRSSTLHQPTASSLARMQATVKPTPRPIPATPIATHQPFGPGTSRGASFDGVNVSTKIAHPLKPALRQNVPASPLKSTPKKSAAASASRARSKASGLSAVKSKGNLRAEAEVNARRAEMRAKQQRIGEERELRAMLGDVEME